MTALSSLDRLITQAGVAITLQQALLGMALCGSLSFVLLRLLAAVPPAPALIVAAALGGGVPVLDLLWRKGRRLCLIQAQLPPALDLLAHHLRRDDPVTTALASVARAIPEPLRAEFGSVVDETSLGRPLDQALERLSDRIDLPDLRALTIALRIGPAAGRELAGVIDRLARLSRWQSDACA